MVEGVNAKDPVETTIRKGEIFRSSSHKRPIGRNFSGTQEHICGGINSYGNPPVLRQKVKPMPRSAPHFQRACRFWGADKAQKSLFDSLEVPHPVTTVILTGNGIVISDSLHTSSFQILQKIIIHQVCYLSGLWRRFMLIFGSYRIGEWPTLRPALPALVC